MPYEEKPSTRQRRIVIAALLWLILGPLLIGLFYLMGWWGLIFATGSVWLTWDYIRKGSFVDADDVTRAGGWAGKGRSGR